MSKQIGVYVHPEEVARDCIGCMFNISHIDCPNEALALCYPQGSNPGIIFKTEPSKPVFTIAEQNEEDNNE